METLLKKARQCTVCASALDHHPRPVLSCHHKSRIVIIGQAPGSIVHRTGKPWDDKSGENLRNWMGVTNEQFYDNNKIALIPMGFCYPGKGKSGDLPPRKECAPLWHNSLFEHMKDIELILLVGKYAQDYYLPKSQKNLTETVKNYKDYLPQFFALPHPSPRNNIWQAKNQWFKKDVLPSLKKNIADILKTS